jgi:tRNA(fMet)-specific endonuclease VapC
MRYLVDTNIISDMIRNPYGKVSLRVRQAGDDRVCTSIIVAAELRYGAAKRGSAKLTTRIEGALDRLDVLSFEAPADRIYRALRARLEKKGRVIRAHDLLIAAHALAVGFTLVTGNEREFVRIPELSKENWLK